MDLRKQIRLETIMYILAICLGLFFRLYHLGTTHLSDSEAYLSLQSLEVAHGQNPIISTSPLYILWTGFLFFIFNSSSFLARFIPAITGSIVVFIPYLLRKKIGNTTAVVLAFALALDPSLIAVSRTAGGESTGLVFLLLAYAFYVNNAAIPAGILSALALLSGPSVWHGVFSLAGVNIWKYLSERKTHLNIDMKNIDSISDRIQTDKAFEWKKYFITWGLTISIFGTIFFYNPAGLSAVMNDLLSYFKGWTSSPLGMLQKNFMALLVYETIPLFFGLWGVFRCFLYPDRNNHFLSRWFFISTVLVLFFPIHHMADLIWIIIPLWIVTSIQLTRYFNIEKEEIITVVGHGLAIFILIIFIVLNVLGMINVDASNENLQLRLFGMVGALLLIILVTFFIGWGWSIYTASRGFIIGCIFSLTIFILSQGWKAGGLGLNKTAELWNNNTQAPHVDLLLSTMGDYSEFNSGVRNEMDIIALNDVASPSIRWILRNQRNVEYMEYIPIELNPSMVITKNDYNISLTTNYTGQQFMIEESAIWEDLPSEKWFLWAFLRKIYTTKKYAILWIRSDLFPAVEAINTGIQ